jgi:hypothetical protein
LADATDRLTRLPARGRGTVRTAVELDADALGHLVAPVLCGERVGQLVAPFDVAQVVDGRPAQRWPVAGLGDGFSGS